MRVLMPAVLLSLSPLPALRALPQHWSPDFTPRGVSGSASSLLAFDDGSGPALFVAGRLGAAGALPDVVIAAWGGSDWRPVATGLQSFAPAAPETASVSILESFDSGAGPELYAAGHFSAIDGVVARSIAKLTPQGWAPIGASVTTTPQLTFSALATVHYAGVTELYAGHQGSAPSGAPSGSLSKWNGTQWLGVGAPLVGEVLDIAAFDDGSGEKLYVAGQLLQSLPTVSGAAVVAWDGASWSVVGGATAHYVRRILAFDDGSGPALYAAGFTAPSLGGVSRYRNGAWEQIGEAFGGEVNELTLLPTVAGPRLVATGTFDSLGTATSAGLALWDGAAWQNIGASGVVNLEPNSAVLSTAILDIGAGPRLYFGGSFLRLDDVAARNVASWNGVAFESLGRGAGLDSPAATFESFEGALYAGGAFRDAPGANRSFLARWSGVEWSADAPAVDAAVQKLGPGDLGSGERLYVAHLLPQPTPQHFLWDGALTTPLPAPGGESPLIETQLVHDSGAGPELYVAGRFVSVDGVTVRNIARWNGQTWSSVGVQAPKQPVYALAFHDDGQGGGEQLYAAGSFTVAGGQAALRVARFDGATWGPVGLGLSAPVNALVVHDDGSGPKLYAGGSFGFAPPFAAPGVARWNGVSWEPVGAGLGDGLSASVNALAVHDDGSGPVLIAGGSFLTSGANVVRRLARWDGAAWTEFGGGADGTVTALASLDDGTGLGRALWVGGNFRTVGGVVSTSVARWGKTCEPQSYCSSGVTSSGCTPTMGASGRASASQATSFVLNATSLEGARSGHLFYGVNGAIASPWGQSSHLLCVKAPTQRTPTQLTGGLSGSCDGAMTLDWHAFTNANPGALGQPFQVGQDVWTQAYFRDPPSPKTTALSNALRFTICP